MREGEGIAAAFGWLIFFVANRHLVPSPGVPGEGVAAKSDLASMYELGHGVPVDLAHARELYTQAADEGDETALKWVASHTMTSATRP